VAEYVKLYSTIRSSKTIKIRNKLGYSRNRFMELKVPQFLT